MGRTLVAGLDFGFQKLSVCLVERNFEIVCYLENSTVCCLFGEGGLMKADGLGSFLEVVVVHCQLLPEAHC